jgi:hypothetical protein
MLEKVLEAWEKLLNDIPDYPDREKVEQLIARAKRHSKLAPGHQDPTSPYSEEQGTRCSLALAAPAIVIAP